MCLLYLFVNPQPKPDEYLLVLANVRDEFFGRPTSGCHVWERNPQLVGRGRNSEPLPFLEDWEASVEALHNHDLLRQGFVRYNTALPSSASVERAFSVAADLLTGKRRKMTDEDFEAMDLEEGKAGGTWLGMNVTGKLASLLNIIQPLDEITGDEKLPRGHLVVKYLEGQHDGASYLRDLSRRADDFDRFLLVTLDIRPSRQDIEATCYTNALDAPPVSLKPGFHAFGNSNPLRPWRKVVESRRQFSDIVRRFGKTSRKQALVDELLAMMRNSTEYFPDAQLLKDAEGRSEESLRGLSSVFVRVEDEYYGSRTHTVILVDSMGSVDYVERTMQQPIDLDRDEPWLTTVHRFGIQETGSLVSRL